MIANYLPTPDLETAPAIIQELRAAFDLRLEQLHAAALRLQQGTGPGPTKMLHVPFAYNGLDVEAMYDREQDLFTQLVARPGASRGEDRPSWTVSVFLVTA